VFNQYTCRPEWGDFGYSQLSKFLELGGLERDLTGIRDAGLESEASHISRSVVKSAGKGATANVWLEFAAVQKEYRSVMDVVNTVTFEAIRNGESPDMVAKLEGILADETAVTVSVVEDKDKDGTPKKKKKVSKSEAQEAIRAEITKDAGALVSFTEVHPKLTERRVTLERLNALKQRADALSGLLADRESVKGEGKASTKTTYDSVEKQRHIWRGTYRILAALGRKDERVRALLKNAAK
jgi:hypothetical protein